MGYLFHAWQDYYAHAVNGSNAAGSAIGGGGWESTMSVWNVRWDKDLGGCNPDKRCVFSVVPCSSPASIGGFLLDPGDHGFGHVEGIVRASRVASYKDWVPAKLAELDGPLDLMTRMLILCHDEVGADALREALGRDRVAAEGGRGPGRF